MPSSHTTLETRFFRFASICFLVAAAFHLIGFLFPQPDDHQSLTRHLCFVLIDLTFAGLFLFRPGWLIFVYAAFLVEQYFQHGSQIRLHYQEHGKLSLVDSLVLMVLTGIMVFLLCIWFRRRSQTNQPKSE